MQAFNNLGLKDELLKAIEDLGFSTPTPVQELVMPVALEANTDLVALAQTGTGKTATFGLPLLQLVDPTKSHVQALVLCPTRELCVQVANDLNNYAKYMRAINVTAVYGGASIVVQMKQLQRGSQIVVATPGRLIDLINRKAIDLKQIERLVLDEADEMLNMGFREDLDTILSATSEGQNTVWLFSATMSNEVRAIAKRYLTDPKELSVGTRNQGNQNIEHIYYACRGEDRYLTLKRIVDANPGIYGLIFCRTKAETKEIADEMTRDGYNSEALHGDLAQSERDRTMNRFRERTVQLLIATDVAARGIDVSDISHVIHYGLPDDTEVYTHRSGRTGRAGKKGISIAIVSAKFEFKLRGIERMVKSTFTKMPIPTGAEVCESQLMHIIGGIRTIPVHKEIEAFVPQMIESLNDMTKEELITRFASVEFNRFLTYYKNSPDLNIRPRDFGRRGEGQERAQVVSNGRTIEVGSGSGSGSKNADYQRIFINVGELDGMDKREFMNLITRQFDIPETSIGPVDINKAYTHFDLHRNMFDKLKDNSKDAQLNGREIRIDDATPRKKEGPFRGGSEKKPFNGSSSYNNRNSEGRHRGDTYSGGGGRSSEGSSYGGGKREGGSGGYQGRSEGAGGGGSSFGNYKPRSEKPKSGTNRFSDRGR
jgi:ATP-dependent RNA helicase DeaD